MSFIRRYISVALARSGLLGGQIDWLRLTFITYQREEYAREKEEVTLID